MDPAIFSVADLLDSVFAAAHVGAFDLLLDKGTYDAISLSGEPAHRRRFIETAATIVKPETGRFLITSCNWTQDELIAHFQPGRHRSRRCGPIESALTAFVRYTTLCLGSVHVSFACEAAHVHVWRQAGPDHGDGRVPAHFCKCINCTYASDYSDTYRLDCYAHDDELDISACTGPSGPSPYGSHVLGSAPHWRTPATPPAKSPPTTSALSK